MNDAPYRPTARCALILSPDPLAGALVGAAVELAGVRIAFPRPGEAARDALGRCRPAFLLIDVDDASAMDESLLGPALMMGARVVFFGGPASGRTRDVASVATRFQARVLALPRDSDTLAELLSGSEPREQLQR